MLLKVLGMPTPQMIALYKDIKVTIYVYDKVSVYASHLFYSGKLVKIEPHHLLKCGMIKTIRLEI